MSELLVFDPALCCSTGVCGPEVDPDAVIVTLPETTSVHEAERLQEDLRRAGIEPFAWVVNQSLAAAKVSGLVLVQRAASEVPLIARVRAELAARMAVVPLLSDLPVGSERLREMLRGDAHQLENSHV